MGVAMFLDDLLIYGCIVNDHLKWNLLRFQRLQDRRLRFQLEKSSVAQNSVRHLRHTSNQVISKSSKVNTILKMTNFRRFKPSYFLGSVSFFGKFIPNISSVTEAHTRLTRKCQLWGWEKEKQTAFLKEIFCRDSALAYFYLLIEIGILCDASSGGIVVALFHRYFVGSERPIATYEAAYTGHMSTRMSSECLFKWMYSSCAETRLISSTGQSSYCWLLPEKSWTRVHIGHTINLLDSNWFALVYSNSKYPCVSKRNPWLPSVQSLLLRLLR